ncbi:TPA: ATP-binding cassette domain-containing protein [Candidatus Poribacteria bacterium]|nr:ATP-binding cassette domain-containing protein [Candidatus Poribacteria bacterium]
MIEVEKLTKRYGNFTAIEDVTFNVNEGEVVGFLGPNAAGKTTTMRILTCFMPATDGTARVAGYDIFRNPLDVKRHIGYLPENVPLYTEMSVESYLNFMAKIKGVSGKLRKQRVDSAIEACGLERFRNRLIGKLSKGYRQRVGLAQSLVHNPPVLILDEPTIGLDPRQIIEIRNLIKNLGGDHTVILSTHILPEASMICSRVIVINEGKIAGTVSLKEGKVSVIESRLTGKVTNLEESGSIYVKVQGPSDKVTSRLKLIPHVIDVILEQEDGDLLTYIVTHEIGADVRAELTSTMVYSGWRLLELRPVEMTLEDAFLELIRENVPEDMDEEKEGEQSNFEDVSGEQVADESLSTESEISSDEKVDDEENQESEKE